MRDATDYYNLLSDSLKNGRNQIKYLYDKIDNAIEKGEYINVRTGRLIKEKDCKDKNYYFYYDYDYPVCYHFSCCGLARNKVLRKMLEFYVACLREYHRTKDNEKMKLLVDRELELARKNYENLNKNNNGKDDLKLFNIPPHIGEPPEVEESVNSSSFINDNSSSDKNDSFINDGDINEEKEEDENEEKIKKKKLVKNGKSVNNEYKKELDDLLEENYDGEEDLKKEDSEYDYDLDLDTKQSSFKKKKLCKTLNKKTKRNIINDSDEEENENESKEENNKEKDGDKKSISKEENASQEIKKLLIEDENEEEEFENDNNVDNCGIRSKKKKEPINEEYYRGLKEKMKLKQGTLDAFLNISQ